MMKGYGGKPMMKGYGGKGAGGGGGGMDPQMMNQMWCMMEMMMSKGGGCGGCGQAACKGKGKGKGKDAGPNNKVFVGGLAPDVDDAAVMSFFSQYGSMSEAKVITGPDGGSKGYAFVTFDDIEAAKQVIANSEQNVLNGQWIDCKFADAANAKAKPGDWYCPMCGDLVFASKPCCNMCGYAGPAGEVVQKGKPGDWVCGSCSKLNFSRQMQCFTCGVERTADAERVNMKPGDWVCPGCQDVQFASKTACGMCGTPKPADEIANASFAPVKGQWGKGAAAKGGKGMMKGKGMKAGPYFG